MTSTRASSRTSFIDLLGREWRVEFTQKNLQEIKNMFGIDLAVHINEPHWLISAMCTPTPMLAVLLSMAIGFQAVRRKVSPEDFGASIVKDKTTYTYAAFAMLNSLAELYPDSVLAQKLKTQEIPESLVSLR